MAGQKNQNADVFLSYNAADKPAVEYVAQRLAENGVQPWVDCWSLIPGEAWQPRIEDALAAVGACAVVIGCQGIGPWQTEEMRAAINRRVRNSGAFRVIPVLLPGANATTLPQFLSATTWVHFENNLDNEDALRRLICGIKGIPPGPARNDHESSDGHWRVVIRCNFEEVNLARIHDIVDQLRMASGDVNLSLKKIQKGSCVLTLGGSRAGYEHIAGLFRAGKLGELIGYDVDSVEWQDGGLEITHDHRIRARRMTCKEALMNLGDYLDESLAPQDRASIENHLSNCPNCWVIFDTTVKTIKIYREFESSALDSGIDVAQPLVDAILAKIGRKPPKGA